MYSLKNVVLALAFVPFSLVTAVLDKPAMRSNLDAFNPGLTNTLKVPSYTVKQWAAGTIAAVCKERGSAEGYDPTKITTYEVTYADCSYPWLLCRHADANTTISTFIDNMGRVPVHMRQYVATTLLVPATYAHAYASGVNLVFFGPLDMVAVYIHETAHAMEFSDAFNATKFLGDQPVWQNSYAADQAVPDEYARTNWREDIAQFPGLALYDTIVAGGVKGVDANVYKIKNQLAQIKYQAQYGKHGGNHFQVSGLTCSYRWANDRATTATGSSRIKRDIFDELPKLHLDEQRQKAKNLGIKLLNDVVQLTNIPEKTECRF